MPSILLAAVLALLVSTGLLHSFSTFSQPLPAAVAAVAFSPTASPSPIHFPNLASELHQRAQVRLAEWTASAGLSAAQVARGLALVGSTLPIQHLERRQAAAKGARAQPANITVLVLGGSTAAGAELGDPAKHFAARFARWLSAVFFDAHVTVLNAAIGATGSDYLALCGGEHVGQGEHVDFVLTDHALNDVGWEIGHALDYGPNLYGAEHAASALEQSLAQVQQAAPGAAYVYAGVYPGQKRWKSGEDLPGFSAVLQHWRVGYVSTRNLVLGPPASWPRPLDPAQKPQPDMDVPLEPPFTWDGMFPGGIFHPRGEADNYLALLLAAWVTQALSALVPPPPSNGTAAATLASPPDAPLQPLLPPSPLHDSSHPAPCLAGPPFRCRTTLSPSFGAPLMPLPTACAVDWGKGVPVLVKPGCDSAHSTWDSAHFDSPALPLKPEEVPLVEGWAWLEMGAVHGGPMGADESGGTAQAALSMRQDRKLYWGATRGGSAARFPVTIGPRGALGLVYITDPGFGEADVALHCPGMEPGGDVPKAKVTGNHVMRVTKTFVLVREGLAPGIRCILKVHAIGRFGIVGVAS